MVNRHALRMKSLFEQGLDMLVDVHRMIEPLQLSGHALEGCNPGKCSEGLPRIAWIVGANFQGSSGLQLLGKQRQKSRL